MVSIADRVRRWLRRPSQTEPPHPFDVEFGMDTSGLYYADRLPSGHAHDQHSEGYYATAPSLFHGAVALWRGCIPIDGQRDNGTAGQTEHVENYSFVDLGSGKGRAVMMASLYPFRTVRGIELSYDLVRVARRNLRKWQSADRAACSDVRVDRGDVLELELPDEPVVLFLFNSFNEKILERLLERLAAAVTSGRNRHLDLIYVHPDHDSLVAQTPGTQLLKFAEVPFSEEDARADLFGVASDMCSVYRIGLPR